MVVRLVSRRGLRWKVVWKAYVDLCKSLELSEVRIGCWKRTVVTRRERNAHRYWWRGQVIFANSCVGARTQKNADYLDACIALTGRAPLAGMHLDEHRKPRFAGRVL